MASQDPPQVPSKTPWPEETGIWATYALHCHCGAIRFNISLSPPLFAAEAQGQAIYPVTACGCSYCSRNGLLSVHPLAKNVEWTRGLADRAEYLCGNKQNPQWFCRQCGSAIGTDLSKLMEMFGTETRYTINVRMLKDFDEKKLTIQPAEFMKDMPPKYSID